jgi:putative redox protein
MSVLAHITVESEAGYAQTIAAGHHHLTADEPASAGGTDTGPAPYALLLSALGACTSITLRMYAAKKGWELGKIHIELQHHKTAEGADQIDREVRLSAPLSDEQRGRLAEIADKTPVTKTIKAGAQIATRVVAA